MSEATRLIEAAVAGDPKAAADLLPLIYDELRRLAAGHMAHEQPGHTLDATALVHEAYVRLVGPAGDRAFASRRHFFAAAAEAMRRILVDHARRRQAAKRGGPAGGVRVDLERLTASDGDPAVWIDLDQALTALAGVDAGAAELATLRVFGGLSVEEAAEAMAMPRATAFRTWAYGRAWLTAALADKSKES
jgi:RNA polymerase sigma factor (TIGR02999 family)